MIIHKGLIRVKAKDKQIATALKSQELSFYITYQDMRLVSQKIRLLDKMNHRSVKGIEILEFQRTIVQEAPHTTGMGIAPAITLAGKINPFGVPPFVAHKVQVAPTSSGYGQKTYHLVQSHSAVYHKTMVKDTHSCIDFLVCQAEENRLIPH